MEKKEHKLSKAELRRKAVFEVVKANLEEDGYETTELTMTTWEANVKAIVAALPFIGLLFLAFILTNPRAEKKPAELSELFVFLASFMVLVVIHELIHGITWGSYAKNKFKSIEFGVIWEYLTPYCTCSEPLKKYQIVLGSLMPTILLGILPGIIACILGSVELAYMAGMMIIGGGADIMVTGKILRHKAGPAALYHDHPYKVGIIVFEKREQ